MNVEKIMSEEIPAKPKKNCPICERPYDFVESESWSAISKIFTRPTMRSELYWSAIRHEECEEAYQKRLNAEREAEILAERELNRQGDLNRWRESREMPVDLLKKTFESYDCSPENQDAFKLIQAWDYKDDFGLLIMGPSGTGKSHLALAVAQRVAEQVSKEVYEQVKDDYAFIHCRSGFPRYFSVSDLLVQAKKTDFDLPEVTYANSLIVLDDLGAENITDWSREMIFRFFEERISKRRPVIITTNLSLNELKERLHERVVSRILGLCVPVQLVGRDRRRDINADRFKKLKSRVTS